MGLEELKKQIAKDMEAKVADMEKQAKLEAKQLREAAKKDVAAYAKRREDEAQKQIAVLSGREDALAELEGKKLVQEARREGLDEVFSSLAAKLQALPAKERVKLIKGLIAKAEKEISVGRICVAQEDAEPLQKEKSIQYEVNVEPMIGGVIAETKDGRVRVDYSFDSLLQEFRQEMLTVISEKLFTP